MEPIRKTPARVTLNVETVEKLREISSQLETEFKDILKFKRDDVVNIILSLRCQKFTTAELSQVREDKFTDKKRAEWLLKQIERSEQSGSEISFEELVKQLQGPKSKKKMKKTPSPSIQGASLSDSK
ncbi:MAG: hypothetical protein HRT44_11455 [Bdellovibrionales bacterium]|nr:hypothetical protein [Bdellovibrionales bacterium]NQZ19858.1 hypothetical protein [Bdellovibrionales bacterium]